MKRLLVILPAILLLCGIVYMCGRRNAGSVPQPVLSWGMERGVGSLVEPDQPNGAVLEVMGAWLGQGMDGTALRFGTAGDWASCFPQDTATGPFSVCSWIRLDAEPVGEFPTIARWEGRWALRFSGGHLGALVWLQDGLVEAREQTVTWNPGDWRFVAAAWDGERVRLWVDGTEVASTEAIGTLAHGVLPLCVGGARGQWPLGGAIDSLAVYDQALTTPVVRAAMRISERSAVPPPAGMQETRMGRLSASTGARKDPREGEIVIPGLIWLDAEDFEDYGGWWLDTQYVHLMGSGFLMAAGVGQPVADATGSVLVEEPGAYRLWVRTRDWLPEYSPGRFEVLVNGAAVPVEFGRAATADWAWVDAGTVGLDRGRNEIRLHDLTGYYGRCDALVFAADPEYRPPPTTAGVRRERARLTGLDLTPQDVGEFDVIVVGAGAAGSCAALAAARNGARTALIQNRPVLGGNSSSELGVPLNGAASAHEHARETGIVEEVGRIKARFGYPRYSEPFQILTEAEPNLSVFLNQHVFATETEDGRIRSVQAWDVLTSTVSRFHGRMFIDCSGDGWLGYFAGAEYRIGREAAHEFGESLAPPVPDRVTMSGCLMGDLALVYRAEDTGSPVMYTPPPWAPRFPLPAEEFGRRVSRVAGGDWWLEHDGMVDDLWEAERARDELIRITFGYWDYIKNLWSQRAQAATYRLAFIPMGHAKRESRRLIGDYVLTQNDVTSGRVFPDRVSYGGWPMDVHHARGIHSGAEGPFHSNTPLPIYTIPFRSLYSANVPNLLMAGRCMSVTHMALGTVRVQSTLGTCGQAAGTAAALCVQRGLSPRDLARDHMPVLQQTLLKQDLTIPGVLNQDPDDLARTARVRASSHMRHLTWEPAQVELVGGHPLNMARGVLLPTGGVPRFDTIRLHLRSERDQAVEVGVHLCPVQATDEPVVPGAGTRHALLLEPRANDWCEVRVGLETSAPYLWIWLEPVPDVTWSLMRSGPPESLRAYGNVEHEQWTRVHGQFHAVVTEPGVRVPLECPPEAVTDGRARPLSPDSLCLWASDPEQELPQWIELGFAEPLPLSLVCLTFDTDLNAPYHDVALVPRCVRDYEVQVEVDGEWRSDVRVTGNYQRYRVHRLQGEPTRRLRVLVRATNGSPTARIYQIRAYTSATGEEDEPPRLLPVDTQAIAAGHEPGTQPAGTPEEQNR